MDLLSNCNYYYFFVLFCFVFVLFFCFLIVGNLFIYYNDCNPTLSSVRSAYYRQYLLQLLHDKRNITSLLTTVMYTFSFLRLLTSKEISREKKGGKS